MSDLGLVAFQSDETQPFLGYELAHGPEYSEATAARIDQEVQRLVAERHEAVRRLLTEAQEQLDQVVETLLREESVTQDTLLKILGPRPQPTEERPYDVVAQRSTGDGHRPPSTVIARSAATKLS